MIKQKSALHTQYRYDLILVLLLSALISLFSSSPFLSDPDVCWHIAAGDLIRQLREIPFFDSWSYIGQKQQWYNISWLWDIACSFLYEALGFQGLAILMDLLNASFIAYIYHALRKEKFSHDAVMVAVALIGMVFIHNSYLRPQLASYALMLYFHNIVRDLPNKTFSGSSLLKLCASFCLWVNTHGSFPLGFIILGAYIADNWIEKRFDIIIRLLVISALCALLTLCNPLGYKIYIGMARTLDSVIMTYISEWRPFAFGGSYSFSLLILSLMIAGIAFVSNYGTLRIRRADWMLGAFSLAMAMTSIRHFIPFVILGRFLIAAVIDRVITSPRIKTHLSINHKKIIIATLGIILPISSTALYILDPDKKIGANNLPIKAIEFIAENYPGQHFFNHYNIGGYVVFFGKGKFKHFIDGRAGTVFTEEDLQFFLDIIKPGAEFLKVIQSQAVRGFIMRQDVLETFSDKELLKNLKEVYSDDTYKIFVLD